MGYLLDLIEIFLEVHVILTSLDNICPALAKSSVDSKMGVVPTYRQMPKSSS